MRERSNSQASDRENDKNSELAHSTDLYFEEDDGRERQDKHIRKDVYYPVRVVYDVLISLVSVILKARGKSQRFTWL